MNEGFEVVVGVVAAESLVGDYAKEKSFFHLAVTCFEVLRHSVGVHSFEIQLLEIQRLRRLRGQVYIKRVEKCVATVVERCFTICKPLEGVSYIDFLLIVHNH